MLRSAHILQLCVLALLGIGVLMVRSAGMRVGVEGGGSGIAGILGSRTTIYALLAAAACLAMSRLDLRGVYATRGWRNPLPWAMAVAVGLCALTLVPGVGRSVNGASRWLQVGPVSFQPSELVKWMMVITLAWWCARRRGVMGRFGWGLMPAIVVLGVGCGVVVVEDLGTAVLIAAVGACVLLAGGARWWQLGGLGFAAAAGFAALIYRSPYRWQRLTAFMDPWADPAGSGYHPIQSMVAIAQGGLAGRGLGNGLQKFGYLPEDTTDFIFAIICEELGVAGAAAVVMLYLVLLWVGLGVVKRSRDGFSRLVGLGVLLTLGLQAAINLAVVAVVVPTKGIALPLVSSGGTGWVMTAAALGLVAAIDNANALEEQGVSLMDANAALPVGSG